MSALVDVEIVKTGGRAYRQNAGLGVYSIGSDASNKIELPDDCIAWRHAILTIGAAGFWIEDLNTDLGTSLDGRRISGRTATLIVRASEAPAAEEATAVPKTSPMEAPKPSPPPPPLPPPPRLPARPPVDPLLEQKRAIKSQIHRELLERLDIKRISTTRIGQDDLSQRARDT